MIASYTQFLQVREILGSYKDHLQGEYDRNSLTTSVIYLLEIPLARERKVISDWISSIPYHAHHRDIYDRVLPGTGGWFFEREEFRQWSDNARSSLLWLRGDGRKLVVLLRRLLADSVMII